MSDVVIRAENLGKKYIIQHQRERQRYESLRDVIADKFLSPWRRFSNPQSAIRESQSEEDFWALKDVSFEIKQGEVVGIIGRNGAGKSTLLKILSRITEPTNGRIGIKGRIASLLEVGTGFHPELTGRENIYLNGAILGMMREEIKRKFDEIVAFAEIEQFLDTPVKRYSSGMYVRLAFAVAAHLEPEILIIDEVLAVGDAAFQKKCLEKMEDVGKSGQTVLFVSHNMGTIQALCKRAIVLEAGKLIADETTINAIKIYMHESKNRISFSRSSQKNGKPTFTLGNLEVCGDSARALLKISGQISGDYSCNTALNLRLKDSLGTPVGVGTFGEFNPSEMIEVRPPYVSFEFNVDAQYLASGSYLISLDLNLPNTELYDRVEDCFSFDLIRQPTNGSLLVLPQNWRLGCVELQIAGLEVSSGVLV